MERQQYDIVIEIVSSHETLAGISRRLGIECGPGSMSRRETRHRKYWSGKVIWQLRAAASGGASLDRSIQVAARLLPDCVDKLLPRCECGLTILVHYYAAYASVVLQHETIALVTQKGLSLTVTAFPCSS